MKTELIKAEDFGLEASKGKEMTKGLDTVLAERSLLEKEFEVVSKLEITLENLDKFSDLRKKIMKNRTQGINQWHTANKAYFLAGGRFVDAIKNKEIYINEQMEAKLMEGEKFFENQEKERLGNLQIERVNLISPYLEDAQQRNFSDMETDVWESYFESKKKSHKEKLEAEAKAEAERIAEIEAQKAEQERIRLENQKLKEEAERKEKIANEERMKREKEEAERLAKEAKESAEREQKALKERQAHEAELKAEREAREKIQKEEEAKREKLEAELRAKKEAEAKAEAEREVDLQRELAKGDADKISDLISDLASIKDKYTFESERNKKVYAEVGILIEKVINHIRI